MDRPKIVSLYAYLPDISKGRVSNATSVESHRSPRVFLWLGRMRILSMLLHNSQGQTIGSHVPGSARQFLPRFEYCFQKIFIISLVLSTIITELKSSGHMTNPHWMLASIIWVLSILNGHVHSIDMHQWSAWAHARKRATDDWCNILQVIMRAFYFRQERMFQWSSACAGLASIV